MIEYNYDFSFIFNREDTFIFASDASKDDNKRYAEKKIWTFIDSGIDTGLDFISKLFSTFFTFSSSFLVLNPQKDV